MSPCSVQWQLKKDKLSIACFSIVIRGFPECAEMISAANGIVALSYVEARDCIDCVYIVRHDLLLLFAIDAVTPSLSRNLSAGLIFVIDETERIMMEA
jgi:hypothetical protein